MVVCVRDPAQTIPSMVDIGGALLNEPQPYTSPFKNRLNITYEYFSKRVYISLGKLADYQPKGRVYWLSFEKWKKTPENELKTVWEFLGLDPTNEDLSISSEKKERHVNRKESYTVVDPDKIKRDLGPSYQKMLRACDEQK
eukprot:CAMPEP_0118675054 /NCGR_PEP_ID=MMETSP0800-20121206/1233_1 /TAXON_ID=210618 ORGANISM="Striatella unipunctata, Strain CCMP2910" /NCGR_SAMPLE_ID=MMETSP0800 /ASSEMBLY_ACC=CAM_ASM_000638 /LENGTH=140 /DNA_ID=CAMNT_0006570323 /DNA_START=650 /DNA_END=1072 /DNA_ORIENTATION=+